MPVEQGSSFAAMPQSGTAPKELPLDRGCKVDEAGISRLSL